MEREYLLNWSVLVEEAIRRRQGMKLTQRDLAGLANVSTPTVSRFEQAAKDVQLSSALAILDVLGMTDKRTLAFPDKEYSYDIERGRHVLGTGRHHTGPLPHLARSARRPFFEQRPAAAESGL